MRFPILKTDNCGRTLATPDWRLCRTVIFTGNSRPSRSFFILTCKSCYDINFFISLVEGFAPKLDKTVCPEIIKFFIQTLNCKVVLWCLRLLFAVEHREFCLNSTCCVDFMKIVLSFCCQHNNSTPQHIIPNMLIPILSFQAQMILRLI